MENALVFFGRFHLFSLAKVDVVLWILRTQLIRAGMSYSAVPKEFNLLFLILLRNHILLFMPVEEKF